MCCTVTLYCVECRSGKDAVKKLDRVQKPSMIDFEYYFDILKVVYDLYFIVIIKTVGCHTEKR